MHARDLKLKSTHNINNTRRHDQKYLTDIITSIINISKRLKRYLLKVRKAIRDKAIFVAFGVTFGKEVLGWVMSVVAEGCLLVVTYRGLCGLCLSF